MRIQGIEGISDTESGGGRQAPGYRREVALSCPPPTLQRSLHDKFSLPTTLQRSGQAG